MRFFSALLNSTSDKLDPDIAGGILQRPVALSLGAGPTGEKVTAAFEVDGKREGSGSR